MSQDAPDLGNRRRINTPVPPADYGQDSAEITPPQQKMGKVGVRYSLPSLEADEDPIVQLNTRVRLSRKKLLQQLQRDTGKTIRTLVEEAIDEKYL